MRKFRQSCIGVLVALTFEACGPPPGGPLPLGTAGCLIGWWHGPSTACDLQCPRQPECSAADCQAFDYLGLAADQSTASGNMTLSRSMGRMSSFGPRDANVWSLGAGGMLILRSGGMPIEARCEGPRLDLGIATNEKYDSRLSTGLDRLKGTQAFASESF